MKEGYVNGNNKGTYVYTNFDMSKLSLYNFQYDIYKENSNVLINIGEKSFKPESFI